MGQVLTAAEERVNVWRVKRHWSFSWLDCPAREPQAPGGTLGGTLGGPWRNPGRNLERNLTPNQLVASHQPQEDLLHEG